MSNKPSAPSKPATEPQAKPARTLTYGVGNPKQGAGGRRSTPSKDD